MTLDQLLERVGFVLASLPNDDSRWADSYELYRWAFAEAADESKWSPA